MDEMMDKLEKYFARLKKKGQKVPSGGSDGNPHFRLISVTAGVDYKFLTAEPARRRINVAVKDLGIDVKHGSSDLWRKRLFEQNRLLVGTYLRGLEKQGLSLPENPKCRGEVFFPQAEIEAGLAPNTLTLNGSESDDSGRARLRGMLKSSIPRLGLGVRVLPHSPGRNAPLITYERLLKRGTEERKHELQGKPNSDQQLYNTRSALRMFCKTLGLEVTAPVGGELVADFKNCFKDVVSRIKSLGSRRKFQTEIRWWYEFYRRLLKEQSLPDDFHSTLVNLIDRSGLSLSIISNLIEVYYDTLWAWYKGDKSPSVRSLPRVSRMESLFRLPAGTLINKLRRSHWGWQVKPSQLPDLLRRNRTLDYRVCRLLPNDFCELSAELQHEIFESVSAGLVGGDDPYARKLAELQKLPYKLERWPARLENEFDLLASFKTADRPPLGMKRNTKWRPVTRDKIHQDLAYFFGALCLPSKAADARMRGLSVPASSLTVALIACPLLVDWYVRFRCEVRSSYTGWVVGFLQNIASMLAAGTGWLRQQPQLASRLRIVSCGQTELVSPELIVRAREDWDRICDAAVKYYRDLRVELKPLIEVGRDPFRRIGGILDMKDPMNAFEPFVHSMKSEIPDRETQPLLHHVAVRNCVLVGLLALTGLRRNTLSRLDYTGRASGHLTLRDGRYLLKIPRAFFKREDSSYFGPRNARTDYLMELPEALGITSLLSEYLNVSRPFLLSECHPGCEEQPLFVNARAKCARMSAVRISTIYTAATEKHLAENKWRGTGIPQVGRHGPHSARHIRGTAVVKKTGSFQMAADANQQAELTARMHYARFSPEDRNRRVNSLLFGEEE